MTHPSKLGLPPDLQLQSKGNKMRRIFAGFVMASAMTLGICGAARADTCANAQTTYTGSITIGDSGTACTIGHAVTATGSLTVLGTSVTTQNLQGTNVTVTAGGNLQVNGAVTGTSDFVTLSAPAGTLTATGLIQSGTSEDVMLTAKNAVTTVALTAGGHLGVTSTNDKITINGAIKSTNGAGAGNVLLQAYGNIKTLGITTNNGSATGGVEIDANTGGGNTLFTVGSSTTNGVNGIITARNGVFITNGTTGSGGITVTNGSDINVVASGYKAGLLFLNAQDGPFVLSAGNLSADGPSGQQAGVVIILANSVTNSAASIISASQATGISAVNHYVEIATKTLNISGTSLQVHSDGNGASGFYATAALYPPGTVTITSNKNLNSLSWNVTGNNSLSTNVPVSVTGGALTMTANGNNAQVQVSGYPVTFSNTTLDFESKGSTNHQVQLEYLATGTGSNGLVFNNTGVVTIDASGTSGGTGGEVDLQQFGTSGGGIAINTPPTFTVSTNGPSSGGNAGPINLYSGPLTVGTSTKVVFTANGPSAGAGNGGIITFGPASNVKLGTNNGDIQFSANGGSTNGNGGTLSINPFGGTVTLDTANAVSASAPGSNGTGGNVTINGSGFSVNSTLSGANINVNGNGTGSGGTITILGGTSLSIGTGTAGSLSLLASNNGTGAGGNIEVGYISTLSLGGTLSTAAGTGGAQSGGNINLHDMGSLNVATGAIINASGQGAGNGGNITLTGGLVNFTGTQTVKTNSSGSGTAGKVVITSTATSSTTLALGANTTLQANSTNGSGGTIQVTTANQPITIAGAGTTVTSNGSGPGGNINVVSSGSTIAVSGTLSANNAGTGSGGTITLNAGSTSTTPTFALGTLQANSTSGNGGTISVTSAGQPLSVTGSNLTVNSGGNGNGGSITLESSANAITVTGTLAANGSGNGNGGEITLTAGSTTNDLNLNNATLSASAGASGTGNGNHVLVTNTGVITLSETTINATGGGAGGNGGVVTIATSGQEPIDLSGLTGINANAASSSSGQGGIVTVTNQGYTVIADIVGLIKVDGGSANQTKNDGSITLNQITCNQLTTGLTPFPVNYWDCANPTTNNDSLVSTFANTLPSGIQSALDQVKSGKALTQIFIFNDGDDEQTFFVISPNPVTNNFAGNTFIVNDGARTITGPFLTNAAGTLDAENFTEVGAHELGHATDNALGTDNQSENGTYKLGFSNDLLYLDYVNGSQSTPRAACSTNGSAPFDGVTDFTLGTMICDPVKHTLSNSSYSGHSNSYIMEQTQPNYFNAALGIVPATEAYAQAFSYLTYVSKASQNPSHEYYQKTADGVFAQTVAGQTSAPFFGCTQWWVSNLVGGALTKPSYCAALIPAWYTPYQ